jgi:hypothetical protein
MNDRFVAVGLSPIKDDGSVPHILIILSDAHAFPLKKKDGTIVEEESGFFLHELAAPLTRFLDEGYQVTASDALSR